MQISDALVLKLLEKSGVGKEKIDELSAHPAADKKSMQYLAVKEGLVSDKELIKLYASEIDMPFIDLKPEEIRPETLSLIPAKVAKKYHAVAFNEDSGMIEVAMEDPEDMTSSMYIRKLIGQKLKLYIAQPEKIKKALSKISAVTPSSVKKIEAKENKSAEIDPENISKAVNELVEKAVELGASDIHIEPRPEFVLTRYRVDGELREYHKLPKNMLTPFVNEIKLIAGLSDSEYELPQSGQFRYESGDRTFTVAVYTIPVLDGEKMVLKIIDDDSKAPTLEDLGLWGKTLKDLKHILAKEKGLVISSGPVGSGRTMTLFSIMSLLYSPSLSVASIEDPIEHRINGVNQSAVNNNLGISFASGLKAILEHDPHIIMVGELRDPETAELVMQAAHKGHLVLTSMFTPNCLSTFKMLASMGIEPHMTAAALNGVVTQRLVRRLCESCKVKINLSSAMVKQIKEDFGLSDFKAVHALEKAAISEGLGSDKTKASSNFAIAKLWQPGEDGCKECDYTGFRGRIGLFEVLPATDKVMNVIAGGKDDTELKKAIASSGLIPLRIDGLIKALRGITTVDEVLRVTTDA